MKAEINEATWQRLERLAERAGITVEALLTRWADEKTIEADIKARDWGSDERQMRIIQAAKHRNQVFRDLDLSDFDDQLVAPDGQPQTLRVWVNAPSVLAGVVSQLDLSDDSLVAAISEYLYRPTGEPYLAQDLQELLDAWEPPLRLWIVRQVFQIVGAYSEERRNFFANAPGAGPSKMSTPNGKSPQLENA